MIINIFIPWNEITIKYYHVIDWKSIHRSFVPIYFVYRNTATWPIPKPYWNFNIRPGRVICEAISGKLQKLSNSDISDVPELELSKVINHLVCIGTTIGGIGYCLSPAKIQSGCVGHWLCHYSEPPRGLLLFRIHCIIILYCLVVTWMK